MFASGDILEDPIAHIEGKGVRYIEAWLRV